VTGELARACDADVESGVRVEPAQVNERALATDALWLFGSSSIYAACQWGCVVALAKLSHAAALGQFGLALAVTNPILMVTGSSLKAYQSSDVVGRYQFADYVNLRLSANLVAGAVLAALALTGIVGSLSAGVLIPVALAKLADATSETCYGLAQKHGRMDVVALSRSLRGILGTAGLTTVVAMGGTVEAGAWALAAAWVGFLLVYDLRVANTLEPVFGRPRGTVLLRLVRETLPLGGIGGVVGMTQAVPRFLLERSHGLAAVGYYTALAAIGPVVQYFSGAIGNASAPRLGSAAAIGSHDYRRLARRLVGVALVASVVLTTLAVIGGREFLHFAYTEDYGAYWSTFVLIAMAAGLGLIGSAAYFALIAARRLGLLLAIHCAGLAVTATIGFFLVPARGPEGAALGAVAGAIVVAVLGAFTMTRGEVR
jgi:O-antigen/teichoic acid export membrane protein